MIKKIRLLLLLLFAIFWFWISFANPIAPKQYCYTLNNVKIDNYRVIVEYGDREVSDFWGWLRANLSSDRKREVYEPKAKECTKCSRWGESKVYLLDKNIDIKNITKENIDDNAIFVWNIRDSDCTSYYDYTIAYKVTKKKGSYELTKGKIKDLGKIKQFPLFLSLAIIIETLVLFFIAKLFREDAQISNKKLLLFWIIPTIITLPLLWFVLPSILWDWILYIIVWELLVAGLEATMIKYWLNISWKRSIMASVICNVFSFVILWWGSLIVDFYDDQWIIFSIPIWVKLYLPVLYLLIEFVILCIVGKLWWDDGEISNKKLILTWVVASIVSVLLLILLVWGVIALDVEIWLENRWVLVAILVSLFVEMFLIKYLLKVSWKKSIIMVILSVLCPIVIVFLVNALS